MMNRVAEHRLLTSAVRREGRWDDDDPVDWDYLIRAAVEHGITPLVLQSVTEVAPPKALAELRRQSQISSHRSLLLVSRLQRILDRFETASIPTLLYKGPALAIQAYGQLALRPFIDLDFLVRPNDLDRASDALINLGYEAYPRLTPARRRSYLSSECECWFDVPDHSSPVELHWAVRERLYSFPMDVEGIFSRAGSVTLCGRQVPTMAPEDLLLVLCIHGAKHGWCQLKWICDLDRIVAVTPQLNWEEMLTHARRLRGERLLLLGLAVAAEVLGTELPQPVIARLNADGVALSLALEVKRRIVVEGASATPDVVSNYLRSREDLRDRFRYCLGMLTTPTLADWEEFSLPDSLFPLYYLHRPLRLAMERARSLLPKQPRLSPVAPE